MIFENPKSSTDGALVNGPKKKKSRGKKTLRKKKAHIVKVGSGEQTAQTVQQLAGDMDPPKSPQEEDGNHRVIARILCYNEQKKRFLPSKEIRLDDCQDQMILLQQNGRVIYRRYWTYQLQHGGVLKFYPQFIAPKKCQELVQTVEENYKVLLRQYRVQNGNEPRLHGLISCDEDGADWTSELGAEHYDMMMSADTKNGEQAGLETEDKNAAICYNYHGVRMKATATVQEFGPVLQEISDQAARVSQLDAPWNIGCDMIVYRNGEDKIGWHADDSQGEQVVFCVVAESPETPRKLQIRPHRTNVGLRDGYEEIQLYPAAGDAYVMDGEMQKFYEHSLPRTKSSSRRLALIFRHGDRLVSSADNGLEATSLVGRVNLTVEERHPFGSLPNVLEEGAVYSRLQLLENHGVVAVQSGVSGTSKHGCSSIIVSRQSPDKFEKDHFDTIFYSSTVRQGALSLYKSLASQNTVRVFRSSDLDNPFRALRNEGSPRSSNIYRYDGIYRVEKCLSYDSNGIPWEVKNDLRGGDALYTFKLKRVAASKTPGHEWNKLSVLDFMDAAAKNGTMQEEAMQVETMQVETMQAEKDPLHLLYRISLLPEHVVAPAAPSSFETDLPGSIQPANRSFVPSQQESHRNPHHIIRRPNQGFPHSPHHTYLGFPDNPHHKYRYSPGFQNIPHPSYRHPQWGYPGSPYPPYPYPQASTTSQHYNYYYSQQGFPASPNLSHRSSPQNIPESPQSVCHPFLYSGSYPSSPPIRRKRPSMLPPIDKYSSHGPSSCLYV